MTRETGGGQRARRRFLDWVWDLHGGRDPVQNFPVQSLEDKFSRLIDEKAVRAVFGNGHAAGVQSQNLIDLADGFDMGVAKQEDGSRSQGRQVVRIPQMAMGGVEGEVWLRLKQSVVCHAGKGQDHLIDFRLAVAPDGQNMVLQAGEHCDDLLGPVPFGQIIAGTMVQKISQQQELVRHFCLHPV